MRSAIVNSAGRTPSPSMKKSTAGHGPAPSGWKIHVRQTPSRVASSTVDCVMASPCRLCLSSPWVSKIDVKRDLDNASRRAHDAHRAGRIAAAVAAGLAIGKLVAGQLGHSAAVTASAADSLMDVFASSANAFAIRAANAAPDRGHPFGHGKIEALAVAGQGLL